MNTHLVLSILFMFGVQDLMAQQKIPSGYHISLDIGESPLTLFYDFNKDGIKDQFSVIEKEGEAKLLATLSKGKKGFINLTHKSTDYFSCCAEMKFEKNIITLTTRGMRYFQHYKFRYNKRINNFELIGYDTENFGNAIHDGAGHQSVNLLTGQYEFSRFDAKDEENGDITEGKKILKMPKKFTLTNFHEAILFLEALEMK